MSRVDVLVRVLDGLTNERAKQVASGQALGLLGLLRDELLAVSEGSPTEAVDAFERELRAEEQAAAERAAVRGRSLTEILSDVGVEDRGGPDRQVVERLPRDIASLLDRLGGARAEEAAARLEFRVLESVADELAARPAPAAASLSAFSLRRVSLAERAADARARTPEPRLLAMLLVGLLEHSMGGANEGGIRAMQMVANSLDALCEARGREHWGNLTSRLLDVVRRQISHAVRPRSPADAGLAERLRAWARSAYAEGETGATEASSLRDRLATPLAELAQGTPD